MSQHTRTAVRKPFLRHDLSWAGARPDRAGRSKLHATAPSLHKTGSDARRGAGMRLLSQNWLTPTELANRLEVGVRTLANWRTEGKGPAPIKVGRNIFYAECDVEEWLQSLRKEPNPHGPQEQKRHLVRPSLGRRKRTIPFDRPRGHETKRERRAEEVAGDTTGAPAVEEPVEIRSIL
jgi:hypothetical protein